MRSSTAALVLALIILLLVLAILLAPLAAEAQQTAKRPRIGIILALNPVSEAQSLAAFEQGLREIGYQLGGHISLETRWVDGKFDRFPQVIAELAGLPVDLLVVKSTGGAIAAREANLTIPVVFVVVADPLGLGIVKSLRRPGGNVTGITNITDELAGKRLELLKEAIPKLTRVAVILNPTYPLNASFWRQSISAAATLGLRLERLELRAPGELKSVFDKMTPGVDALTVFPDPLTISLTKEILDAAIRKRLPSMLTFPPDAANGALMAYGAHMPALWRRASIYVDVDKVLKGAKPADLPVEQPTKFDLVINLKTAKALGLTLPPSLLLRADQVIE